eukprot:augustus_masked-scaffold_2-processed-gene-9.8-mRNA-1 protein AED:1.00 eAED:1.00 QI:0/-1/0/0/-1/1/1/0/1234
MTTQYYIGLSSDLPPSAGDKHFVIKTFEGKNTFYRSETRGDSVLTAVQTALEIDTLPTGVKPTTIKEETEDSVIVEIPEIALEPINLDLSEQDMNKIFSKHRRRPSQASISIFTGDKRKYKYTSDDYETSSSASESRKPVAKKSRKEKDSEEEELAYKSNLNTSFQAQKADEDMSVDEVLKNFPSYNEKVTPFVGAQYQAEVPELTKAPIIRDRSIALAEVKEQRAFMPEDAPGVFLHKAESVLKTKKISTEWSQSERVAFEKGLYEHSTDFDKLAKYVRKVTRGDKPAVKSVKQCIRYFYDVFYSTRAYRVWRKHDMERLEKIERRRRDEERQKLKAEKKLQKKEQEEQQKEKIEEKEENQQVEEKPVMEEQLKLLQDKNAAVAAEAELKSTQEAVKKEEEREVVTVKPTETESNLDQYQMLAQLQEQQNTLEKPKEKSEEKPVNMENSTKPNQTQASLLRALQQISTPQAANTTQAGGNAALQSLQTLLSNNTDLASLMQQKQNRTLSPMNTAATNIAAQSPQQRPQTNLANSVPPNVNAAVAAAAQGRNGNNVNLNQKLQNLQQLQLLQLHLQARQEQEQHLQTFLRLQQEGRLSPQISFENYVLLLQQDQLTQLKSAHMYQQLLQDANSGQNRTSPAEQLTQQQKPRVATPQQTSAQSLALNSVVNQNNQRAQREYEDKQKEIDRLLKKVEEQYQSEKSKLNLLTQQERLNLQLLHTNQMQGAPDGQKSSLTQRQESDRFLLAQEQNQRMLTLENERKKSLLMLQAQQAILDRQLPGNNMFGNRGQQESKPTRSPDIAALAKNIVKSRSPNTALQHAQTVAGQAQGLSVGGQNQGVTGGGITLAQLQQLSSSAQGLNTNQTVQQRNNHIQQVLNLSKERQQQKDLAQKILNNASQKGGAAGAGMLPLNLNSQNGANMSREHLIATLNSLRPGSRMQNQVTAASPLTANKPNASVIQGAQNQALEHLKRISGNFNLQGQQALLQAAQQQQQQKNNPVRVQPNMFGLAGQKQGDNNLVTNQQHQNDTMNLLKKMIANQQQRTGQQRAGIGLQNNKQQLPQASQLNTLLLQQQQQQQQQQRAQSPNQVLSGMIDLNKLRELQGVHQIQSLINHQQQTQLFAQAQQQNRLRNLQLQNLQHSSNILGQNGGAQQQNSLDANFNLNTLRKAGGSIDNTNAVVNPGTNLAGTQGQKLPVQPGQNNKNVACQEPGCNKSYTQRHNLLNHIRRKHPDQK